MATAGPPVCCLREIRGTAGVADGDRVRAWPRPSPLTDGPPTPRGCSRHRPSSRALPLGRSGAPAVRWRGASILHTPLHRVARDAARPVAGLRLAHPVAAGPCPQWQHAELGLHLPLAVLRLLCDLRVVAAVAA